jgi:hypothetical protein
LRAFLTSVIVQPAKSRNAVAWLRKRLSEQFKPGPAVITKNELQPAAKPAGNGIKSS